MTFRRALVINACLTAFLCSASGQTVNPRALFDDAMAADRGGNYEQAIRDYRQLLQVQPDLLPAYMNLGIVLTKVGRFSEAIESYQSALTLAPKNRDIQFDLALAYFKKGDMPNAARQFEDLLKANSGDLRIAILLGASYTQSGQSAHALEVLTPFAAKARDNPDFLWAYGSALIANGHLKDGIAVVEQVAKQTNAAEAWLLAGQTQLRVDQFDQAKADLETAARLDPTLAGVQNSLGHAREKEADYPGAIQAFSQAVAQKSDDADAWLALAGDQYFQRDLPGARASLAKVLALEPTSAPAFYALGLVDKAEAKLGPAVTDMEQAVKIRPDWMEAHVQLAALYFQLHRNEDGMRERKLVDNLAEAQRKAGPGGI